MTNPFLENVARVNRRQLFGSAASGVGLAALASLLGKDRAQADEQRRGERGLPDLPHFAPKARRVIILWQGGGPSHVDLFDPKPAMQAMAGKDIPDSIRGMTRLSTMSSGYARWPTLPAIKPFKKYGQWLHAKNRLLDGQRPVDLLAEDRYQDVRSAAESFIDGAYV